MQKPQEAQTNHQTWDKLGQAMRGYNHCSLCCFDWLSSQWANLCHLQEIKGGNELKRYDMAIKVNILDVNTNFYFSKRC